ncbi:hydroxyethylthiazole kinase [Marinifilum flexuosum]|uniref:Hydroxyethylthiazole kinase n=1 Tax=Marinifilum flexuosum TaxID=1117708 RepID=A0A419X2Q1_9BACT|nr:hydroxyethylthiazole kinase [Marinifilum flexuosum]RKE01992.1 hydroxyethylthiazole kinase [Marinifilum flexuosum]
MNPKMITENLEAIRKNSPLVHNITNYVVMNNTANALLAIGASPVMAHAQEEVKDMVGIASALVLNMGTLSKEWVESMIIAGLRANERKIPIVFDPVGAGATAYRNEIATRIINNCNPEIIRGNASEIMALVNQEMKTKGVDSVVSTKSALDSAKYLAQLHECIVVISGEVDYITDGNRVERVAFGNSMMEKVTGMGCTATALLGAFVATNDNLFEAAVNGMTVMGITGELASAKANGPGSMQMHFLDCLYKLSEVEIEQAFCTVE